jgi:hypothetical protein
MDGKPTSDPTAKKENQELAPMITRIAALSAMLVLALATATPALAQSGPQLQGYSDEGGQTQDVVNQPTSGDGDGGGIAGQTTPAAETAATATTSDGGSSLPFTGLDLGLMAAAAAGLFGLGYGLRRLARAPQAL